MIRLILSSDITSLCVVLIMIYARHNAKSCQQSSRLAAWLMSGTKRFSCKAPTFLLSSTCKLTFFGWANQSNILKNNFSPWGSWQKLYWPRVSKSHKDYEWYSFVRDNLQDQIVCFSLDPSYLRGRVYKRKFCLYVCLSVRLYVITSTFPI